MQPNTRSENHLGRCTIGLISFPNIVGAYSYACYFNLKNISKAFGEKCKIKIKPFEVLRLNFNLINYMKDNLQLESSFRHIPMLMDHWDECVDELVTRERFYSRMTIQKIKLYGVNINMNQLEDDKKNMQSSTYLKGINTFPIDSTPSLGSISQILQHLIG